MRRCPCRRRLRCLASTRKRYCVWCWVMTRLLLRDCVRRGHWDSAAEGEFDVLQRGDGGQDRGRTVWAATQSGQDLPALRGGGGTFGEGARLGQRTVDCFLVVRQVPALRVPNKMI